MKNCPCGSQKFYADCCGAFIDAGNIPATPEELMRSRYTAYAQVNIDYIERTMKPPASNGFNKDEARLWAQQVKWKELKLLKSGKEKDKNIVEFQAYYEFGNKVYCLHEISEFQILNQKWYYSAGKIIVDE
jgi:SEC-C motif domain protein